MQSEKENDEYVKDWREWQDNQYNPGHYLGSKLPLPLKQLGKKPWFKNIVTIYLILFGLALTFAFWEMFSAINQRPNF